MCFCGSIVVTGVIGGGSGGGDGTATATAAAAVPVPVADATTTTVTKPILVKRDPELLQYL